MYMVEWPGSESVLSSVTSGWNLGQDWQAADTPRFRAALDARVEAIAQERQADAGSQADDGAEQQRQAALGFQRRLRHGRLLDDRDVDDARFVERVGETRLFLFL